MKLTYHQDILFNAKSIHTDDEGMNEIISLFREFHRLKAIAYFAEIVDLNKPQKTRKAQAVQSYLRQKNKAPFSFLLALN
jgi:hypothetical protein